MTPNPQQHCGHEGWCWHQILGCIPLEDGKPRCVREECRGDTRSRPLTPAPTAEFTDAENKWCDDYAAAYNRGFDAGAKAAHEPFIKFFKDISFLTICSRKDGYEYRMVPEGYIQEMLQFLRGAEDMK